MSGVWIYYLVFLILWLLVTFLKEHWDTLKDVDANMTLSYVSTIISLLFLVSFISEVAHSSWIFKTVFLLMFIEETVILVYESIKFKEFMVFFTPKEEIESFIKVMDKIFIVTNTAILVLVILYQILLIMG